MFEKSMRKSIEPYLEEGEVLLACVQAQSRGAAAAMFTGTVTGIRLGKQMAVAITPRRLMIFRTGRAMTVKARELLTEAPIGEVEAIDVGRAVLTKPVTLTMRGATFTIETPKAAPAESLVEALERARPATHA